MKACPTQWTKWQVVCRFTKYKRNKLSFYETTCSVQSVTMWVQSGQVQSGLGAEADGVAAVRGVWNVILYRRGEVEE